VACECALKSAISKTKETRQDIGSLGKRKMSGGASFHLRINAGGRPVAAARKVTV
jgi:hypothetical protein